MDKKDISTSEDVQLLVYSFYERALVDDDIGSIFQEQIGMDLKNHLPIICSFWDSVLLGKNNFKRNPILKHIELAKKVELKKVHFDRWLALWEVSISFHFTGPIAEMAWKRAKVMAQLMLYKIEESRKDGFIQ